MDAHRTSHPPTKPRARSGARGSVVAFPRQKAAPPGPPLPAIPPPDPSFIRDSYASTALAEIVDRSVHAATARFTVGLSPMALMGAYMDWAAHVAFAPGKQAQLAEKAFKKWVRLANYAGRSLIRSDGNEPCIEPLPQDRRFDGEAWRSPPFDVIYQAFLLGQQWWHNATTGVRGVNGATRTWSRSRPGRSSTCGARRTLVHQPRGARAHAAGGRDEPRPRLAEFPSRTGSAR